VRAAAAGMAYTLMRYFMIPGSVTVSAGEILNLLAEGLLVVEDVEAASLEEEDGTLADGIFDEGLEIDLVFGDDDRIMFPVTNGPVDDRVEFGAVRDGGLSDAAGDCEFHRIAAP